MTGWLAEGTAWDAERLFYRPLRFRWCDSLSITPKN